MPTAEEISSAYTSVLNSINLALRSVEDPVEINTLLTEYTAAQQAYAKLIAGAINVVDNTIANLSSRLNEATKILDQGIQDANSLKGYLNTIATAVALLAKLALFVAAL
ncbi:hypothetical protein ABIC71_003229 [Herbaspirillum seropedicae]|uniref:hypothetical protein n=1 Tax=Herbaspirillum seropedicae TaxID=964 RepID=UPI000847F580|nr:hypothetical protein [Herbaspirillum seropedicae]AON56014.1 hypothetical protein Hsc_3748 [Herbaspirillum seropedicae]